MGVGNRLSGSMRRLRENQRRRSQDRFTERVASVAKVLAPPEAEEPPVVEGGESNYAPGRVPHGVDLAAAWAWRLLVIGAAGYFFGKILSTFEVIVLPLVIALLLSALVGPLVTLLHRYRIPRGLGALLVVVGSLGLIALLVGFAGQQVASNADNLASQVVDGLEKIRVWLKSGPLKATDTQINDAIKQAQGYVTSGNQHLVTRATEVGAALGHILAGFFIILFATYFFLADGNRIWAWLVRIFPRVARPRADSSGRIAWTSLTRFVRATVLVAFTDALGIMLVAWILKVPLVFALGILVFLGAFIPLIGATLSGSVAVLVALVAHGPIVALIMLGGVIAVQQLEAHVLQPFLMGRMVSVHPLGVIVAIGAGVLVAGIPGALVAVPLVAALNAVVVHLADTAGAERTARSGPANKPPPGPAPGAAMTKATGTKKGADAGSASEPSEP
jgi:predicted PurR-regulated permease PerM